MSALKLPQGVKEILEQGKEATNIEAPKQDFVELARQSRQPKESNGRDM